MSNTCCPTCTAPAASKLVTDVMNLMGYDAHQHAPPSVNDGDPPIMCDCHDAELTTAQLLQRVHAAEWALRLAHSWIYGQTRAAANLGTVQRLLNEAIASWDKP